jgi:uncharacterized protein
MNVRILEVDLNFLAEKAIYLSSLNSLLVSDVHLGKSETFQALGVPISNAVNQATLKRLRHLCEQFNPDHIFVLGDLFHSKFALVDEVFECWFEFLNAINADVKLILGNHDRALVSTLNQLSIECIPNAIQIDTLVLSHEPSPQFGCLNICGHVHPCVNLKTKLDRLRLPCFYFDGTDQSLILPSFGEFTGGYEVDLKPNSIAYVVAENQVIEFKGSVDFVV